jgi:hypothetical protein
VHRDNETLYVQDIPRKQIWNVKEIPFFNENASSNNPHNVCRLEHATSPKQQMDLRQAYPVFYRSIKSESVTITNLIWNRVEPGSCLALDPKNENRLTVTLGLTIDVVLRRSSCE